MKFRKLGMLALSSFIILSACGQNTEDNHKKTIIKHMKRIKNQIKLKINQMMKLQKTIKIQRINLKVSLMLQKQHMKLIAKIVNL